MLDIDVSKRLGETRIDVTFRSAGPVTALFGPSGSGKTSVVNMIAGILEPDRGRIALGDQVLFDGARGVRVPAHRRRIGYVFQEARLFPHLSVKTNLAFGRWMNGVRRDLARERRVLDLLGIGHLLERRPRSLSGGEKQRVAIGRALLLEPRLLLMDEPLASLDEARKAEILPYLERLRDETATPIVYVSHATTEVRRLADVVVRLEAGRVMEVAANAVDGMDPEQVGP
jgi:molybdate transport system ATP-binding protein